MSTAPPQADGAPAPAPTAPQAPAQSGAGAGSTPSIPVPSHHCPNCFIGGLMFTFSVPLPEGGRCNGCGQALTPGPPPDRDWSRGPPHGPSPIRTGGGNRGSTGTVPPETLGQLLPEPWSQPDGAEGLDLTDPLGRGVSGPPGHDIHPSLEASWDLLTNRASAAAADLFRRDSGPDGPVTVVGHENTDHGPWLHLVSWLIWATSIDVLRTRARATWASFGLDDTALTILEN